MTSVEDNIKVLHNLIVAGDDGRVKDLLRNSSGPKRLLDTVSEHGYTALFKAMVEKCEVPMLEALLKAGPTIDGLGEDGETPLYIACHNRLAAHVKLLLAAGANVNSRNGASGECPLHAAARFGFVSIAETLIKNNADINATGKAGETPLYVASKAGKHDMVYFLLANDANKIIADRDGKNALYIASEKGNKYCVALLKADKAELRTVKSTVDTEAKHETTRMATPEEIAARLADDKAHAKSSQETERELERKAIAAAAADAKLAEMALKEAHAHPKVIRTHDPFTGKALGPCRTLEEVGYTLPPQAPPGMVLQPVVYPPGGGTSMVVGTGTDEEFKQPPHLGRGDIDEDGPGVLTNGAIRF